MLGIILSSYVVCTTRDENGFGRQMRTSDCFDFFVFYHSAVMSALQTAYADLHFGDRLNITCGEPANNSLIQFLSITPSKRVGFAE